MALPPIQGQGIGSLIQNQDQLDANYTWATNRPQTANNIRRELMAPNGGEDPTVNKLESYTPIDRGSREKPLLMRYPSDIGSASSSGEVEIPHIMQFKVFWRWENPEFKEVGKKLKSEAEATLRSLVDATNLILDGNFNMGQLAEQGGLVDPALLSTAGKMLYDPSFADPANPSDDKVLSDLLSNPETREEGRRILERNVQSATNRVESIGNDFGTKDITFGGSDINKDPDFLNNRFNKALATGAAGKANSLLAAVGLQQRDPQYDQMVSVYLPVCTKINGEDAFGYTDANMGLAGSLLGGANAVAAGVAAGGGVSKIVGSLSETLKQGAVAYATNKASGGPFAGVVPAVTGLVLNPRVEKMFTQKELRNFSFSWDFYPKNQEEVNSVKSIIETFRYHAHPARSAGEDQVDPQIMLRVPAEFTIKFLSSSSTNSGNGFVENEHIPKISRCVLTNIGVDYTVNGVFSTLPDNSPSAYTLTLSFSEVAQLTREDVGAGY